MPEGRKNTDLKQAWRGLCVCCVSVKKKYCHMITMDWGGHTHTHTQPVQGTFLKSLWGWAQLSGRAPA
jgi:hypothetical protein